MLCDGKSIHQIISFPWQIWQFGKEAIICGNFPLLQWNFDGKFLFLIFEVKILQEFTTKKNH
jgi:hypothetical protein